MQYKSHTGILYSQEAVNYQKEVNTAVERLKKYENKVYYVETVDDKKYSELNEFLFKQIIDFYNNCI